MKYLSRYIEDAQTKLFNDTGTFFAFSDKQFNEGIKEGVKYTFMGAGMICPVENVKTLIAGLDAIHEAGIKADIAENGIEAIIARELSNHEAYYTYDISDTVDSLEGYNVTNEQIQDVFNKIAPTIDA